MLWLMRFNSQLLSILNLQIVNHFVQFYLRLIMEGKKKGCSTVTDEQTLEIVNPASVDAIYERQQKIKSLRNNFNNLKQAKTAKKVLYNSQLYELGDCVEVYDATLNSPYVARIINFYIFDQDIELIPIVELAWCIQVKHLPESLRRSVMSFTSPYEVFLSDRVIYQYITCIKRKVYVLLFNQFASIAKLTNRYYYYRALYDYANQMIIPPIQSWPKQCICQTIAILQLPMIRCKCCSSFYHSSCIKQVQGCDKQVQNHGYICDGCIYDSQMVRLSLHIDRQSEK